MPLTDDFWEDAQATRSAWKESDLPAKEHPATLSWTFINFAVGGIHVATTSRGMRNMDSVCRLAEDEGEWTDEWTTCKSCWAWLKTVKAQQDGLVGRGMLFLSKEA